MTTSLVPYSKTIKLTKGKQTKVSYWWHPFLSIWGWYAMYDKHNYYAVRGYWNGKNMGKILLHRVVLGICDKKILGDHSNRNTLDNTEGNLRVATYSQNCANKKSKGTSKYLGVYKAGNGKHIYWQVAVHKNGKQTFCGRFPFTPEGEIKAAKAYDKKAKESHGEFANLNFKENA